jgi:hypothetical protein
MSGNFWSHFRLTSDHFQYAKKHPHTENGRLKRQMTVFATIHFIKERVRKIAYTDAMNIQENCDKGCLLMSILFRATGVLISEKEENRNIAFYKPKSTKPRGKKFRLRLH